MGISFGFMKGKVLFVRCFLFLICFLNLYWWFWNYIFICVGERFISWVNCFCFGVERYCCCLKCFLSLKICVLENSIFCFCFLVLGIFVFGLFLFLLLKFFILSFFVELVKIKGRKMLKMEMMIDELKNRM